MSGGWIPPRSSAPAPARPPGGLTWPDGPSTDTAPVIPAGSGPLRQVIESVNDTFKGQLDLERHGGHTPAGVTVRVLQHILALTAVIWRNDLTGQPVMRSLIAYDH